MSVGELNVLVVAAVAGGLIGTAATFAGHSLLVLACNKRRTATRTTTINCTDGVCHSVEVDGETVWDKDW